MRQNQFFNTRKPARLLALLLLPFCTVLPRAHADAEVDTEYHLFCPNPGERINNCNGRNLNLLFMVGQGSAGAYFVRDFIRSRTPIVTPEQFREMRLTQRLSAEAIVDTMIDNARSMGAAEDELARFRANAEARVAEASRRAPGLTDIEIRNIVNRVSQQGLPQTKLGRFMENGRGRFFNAINVAPDRTATGERLTPMGGAVGVEVYANRVNILRGIADEAFPDYVRLALRDLTELQVAAGNANGEWHSLVRDDRARAYLQGIFDQIQISRGNEFNPSIISESFPEEYAAGKTAIEGKEARFMLQVQAKQRWIYTRVGAQLPELADELRRVVTDTDNALADGSPRMFTTTGRVRTGHRYFTTRTGVLAGLFLVLPAIDLTSVIINNDSTLSDVDDITGDFCQGRYCMEEPLVDGLIKSLSPAGIYTIIDDLGGYEDGTEGPATSTGE